MWINHHAIIEALARFDMPLKLANGLLLLVVTVVPVPITMISTYPGTSVATVTYAGVFLVSNLSCILLWWVARWRNLLDPEVPASQVVGISRTIFQVQRSMSWPEPWRSGMPT